MRVRGVCVRAVWRKALLVFLVLRTLVALVV
jgi:hypothetical protein